MLRTTPATELDERYRAGDLPSAITDGVAGFLETYGHRAVAEIDLGVPRWSEDPTHILGVLANYLRLDRPELAPDVVFARGDREARQMIEQLTAKARHRGRLRSSAVRFALGRTRALAGIREVPKNDIVLVLAAARRALGAIGTLLASRDLLETADDVYFLTLTETREAIDGELPDGLIVERREAYQREMRRRRVPRVLLSDGTEPEATTEVDDRRRRADRRRRVPGRGHRAGAGHPRSGRRTSGAGRDPRRTVHRPGLDATVPHGRWIGDGNGWTQFARRRGRP